MQSPVSPARQVRLVNRPAHSKVGAAAEPESFNLAQMLSDPVKVLTPKRRVCPKPLGQQLSEALDSVQKRVADAWREAETSNKDYWSKQIEDRGAFRTPGASPSGTAPTGSQRPAESVSGSGSSGDRRGGGLDAPQAPAGNGGAQSSSFKSQGAQSSSFESQGEMPGSVDAAKTPSGSGGGQSSTMKAIEGGTSEGGRGGAPKAQLAPQAESGQPAQSSSAGAGLDGQVNPEDGSRMASEAARGQGSSTLQPGNVPTAGGVQGAKFEAGNVPQLPGNQPENALRLPGNQPDIGSQRPGSVADMAKDLMPGNQPRRILGNVLESSGGSGGLPPGNVIEPPATGSLGPSNFPNPNPPPTMPEPPPSAPEVWPWSRLVPGNVSPEVPLIEPPPSAQRGPFFPGNVLPEPPALNPTPPPPGNLPFPFEVPPPMPKAPMRLPGNVLPADPAGMPPEFPGYYWARPPAPGNIVYGGLPAESIPISMNGPGAAMHDAAVHASGHASAASVVDAAAVPFYASHHATTAATHTVGDVVTVAHAWTDITATSVDAVATASCSAPGMGGPHALEGLATAAAMSVEHVASAAAVAGSSDQHAWDGVVAVSGHAWEPVASTAAQHAAAIAHGAAEAADVLLHVL
jgi:hypothetical protein